MGYTIDTDGNRIREILDQVTQREKLLVAQALDKPYAEILGDADRILPALVWLDRKHRTGGADWNPILDMTDKQLVDELDLEPDEDDQDETAGKEPPGGPSTTTPPRKRTAKKTARTPAANT